MQPKSTTMGAKQNFAFNHVGRHISVVFCLCLSWQVSAIASETHSVKALTPAAGSVMSMAFCSCCKHPLQGLCLIWSSLMSGTHWAAGDCCCAVASGAPGGVSAAAGSRHILAGDLNKHWHVPLVVSSTSSCWLQLASHAEFI